MSTEKQAPDRLCVRHPAHRARSCCIAARNERNVDLVIDDVRRRQHAYLWKQHAIVFCWEVPCRIVGDELVFLRQRDPFPTPHEPHGGEFDSRTSMDGAKSILPSFSRPFQAGRPQTRFPGLSFRNTCAQEHTSVNGLPLFDGGVTTPVGQPRAAKGQPLHGVFRVGDRANGTRLRVNHRISACRRHNTWQLVKYAVYPIVFRVAQQQACFGVLGLAMF